MTQTAYLFPGQGSQTVGMGQTLSQMLAVARETFEEADEALNFALSELIFNGPAELLTSTVNAQPAILVTSIAILRALRQTRPDLPAPSFVAGHSLGEYSALVAADALDFVAAVRLTRLRGELMARAGEANPGSMAAVLKLSDEQVAALCEEAAQQSGEAVQVANYNSPGQVVISGSARGVAAASELAKAGGGRVMPLAVSVAAHSALMLPAAEEFTTAVGQAEFRPPGVPVVGNVHARPLEEAPEIRAELVAQLTAPVLWTASVAYMAEEGVDTMVEIGPGSVLTGLVRRINPALVTANVATPEDIGKL